jgi:outer membrane protein OmpA-like peptidoglycan-associated protein
LNFNIKQLILKCQFTMNFSVFTTISSSLFLLLCFLVGRPCPATAQDSVQTRKRVQPRIVQDARYKSAFGYHRQGAYGKALETYRAIWQNGRFLESANDSLLLLRRIAECERGLQNKAQPEPVTVAKLDPTINDPRYTSLGAFAMNDERTLYFTSSRPKNGSQKSKESSEKPLDNVCVARRASMQSPCGKVNVVEDKEYSRFHQGVLGISPDGKDMFIFSGTNDIFMQNLDRITREVKLLPIAKELNLNIDKRFHVSSLAMTGDRQTVYLCANDDKADDGYGGYDIWSISRDHVTGTWGEMLNLGPDINTKGDELSVSVLPDGKTIFFASDGHKGVGRCDIYRSTYVDSLGIWGQPVHLGYPINTPNDDLYYNPVFDNPKHAYYSVERPDALGSYDIYFVDYQGEILSPEEKEARRKAAEAAEQKAKQREYLLSLQQAEAHYIKPAEAKLIAQKGYSDFPKDSVKVGMKVLLHNIHFHKGKATLLPESYKYLEPLYRLMELYPNMRIRISGHTDNTGSKAANLALSKERAQSVANFLTNNGVNPARFETEGCGQSQPITSNATEAGRTLNRRVEFKVIE